MIFFVVCCSLTTAVTAVAVPKKAKFYEDKAVRSQVQKKVPYKATKRERERERKGRREGEKASKKESRPEPSRPSSHFKNH